ncbi:MAG: DMT family transporter [Proteobacteria bacterium]|nr:DMT family transporter [Pseudomonadota bacterium]NOG59795.1 DMT family transporter [Pseudomonadota bacterium]
MLLAMSSQPTSPYFPALACVVAAILWGLFWYPLRLLEEMGIPGLWSSLIIYCVAMFVMLPFCWKEREGFLQCKREYMLIGLFAGWTNLAFILAVLEGEIVRVLLLFYLSPIWAILLAVLILKEKLTHRAVYSLILAIVGGALMLWHPDLRLIEGIGLADFYAITSGMAFAITNIVIRKMGPTPINLKIGACCIGVIVLTLCALAIVQLPIPDITFNSGILVVLTGFPCMLIMIWTAQYGVTHLPIQRSSVIFLLEIVAGAVSAALLTDEIVRNIEYIGGVFIISAGLISVIDEKSHNIAD